MNDDWRFFGAHCCLHALGRKWTGRQWSRFGVKRAWLFGSRARNRASTASDWDFVVEFFEPPGFDAYMGLKASLEERLRGKVDILSPLGVVAKVLGRDQG